MKKILLSFLAAIGLSTTGCSAQAGQSAPSDSSAKTAPSDGIIVLAPQAFINQAKADSTSFLLDVRTSKEYAEGHLAGAHQLDYLNPEAFDAGIECFGIEVIQLVGASQMTFCIFLGSANIEEETGGIRLCLVDEGLWSQYDDAIRWGSFC